MAHWPIMARRPNLVLPVVVVAASSVVVIIAAASVVVVDVVLLAVVKGFLNILTVFLPRPF